MGHVARKRFGQHFLVDGAVIESIVEAIDPRADERLVEIGPGLAALTDALLRRIPAMTAIEIDRDLVAGLRRRYGDRLTLIEADALSLDFNALAAAGPIRLVGNLPYNISSPLLVHLLSVRESVIDQHFMLQKEVVQRIVSAPDSASYGRLGVLLQAYYDVELLFEVPPEAFDPPPRVDSAIVRMLPRRAPAAVAPSLLSELLAAAFGQRRKMMRNTLLPWLAAHGVAPSGISPTDRPESVPVETYVTLARRLAAARSARSG